VKIIGKIFFAFAAFAPVKIFACAACGSANPNAEHSSMADGMNLGILTLLGVLLTVLSVCLFGLVHLIRKSEALNAAAELKNSPQVSKV
jgi:threonine/homoserine/homoserine lactone efflux protein